MAHHAHQQAAHHQQQQQQQHHHQQRHLQNMSTRTFSANAAGNDKNNHNHNNNNNNNKTIASTKSNDPINKINEWKVEDVVQWVEATVECSNELIACIRTESIDGIVLLALTENDIRDMRYRLNYQLTFGELKKFWLAVLKLQLKVKDLNAPIVLGISGHLSQAAAAAATAILPAPCACPPDCPSYISDCEAYLLARKKIIPPEYFKTSISLVYSFLVTWITSFVMVIVHERVPDMKRYPPLPDIFLDNVPHIPWAFNMCEITGTLLFSIWTFVIIFHRYRTVLLRRFFALAGTVFLLRCVTMLITSLSVPGTHLQCNQKDFAIDDATLDMFGATYVRICRAYTIWSGLGMSIQGVRTCGDYMFSGHTVALTLLNFFITEYTPRHLYFLHTLTWLLNMFGIFFILAAHEHYSIDVFVAFYITSRLFLYYHTLANNQSLMQRDSTRTRIWFPMFSYFESSVECIIPNEYDSPGELAESFIELLMNCKDSVMMTTQRLWCNPPLTSKSPTHMHNGNAATSDLEIQQRSATFFSLNSTNPSRSVVSEQPTQVRQRRSPSPTIRAATATTTPPATRTTQRQQMKRSFPNNNIMPKNVATATSFDTDVSIVGVNNTPAAAAAATNKKEL